MTFKEYSMEIDLEKEEWYVQKYPHKYVMGSSYGITRYPNNKELIYKKPQTFTEARNFRNTLHKLRGK